MQKITIKLLPALLLAALSSGCQKETHSTFMVRMDQFAGAAGEKVYLSGTSPRFELNDKFRINGGTYVISEFNGEWGLVDWIDGEDAEWAPFYAVYPATSVTGVLDASSTVTFDFPQKQYYRTVTVSGTEYQKLNAPMCAKSDDNKLTFKNVCSVIDVKITNNTGDTRYIDSIDVIADNVQLCGTMTITDFGTETPKVVAGAASSGNNWVRLYGIGGVGGKRIDAGATAHYYIYLPTYSNAKLTVKLYDNAHGSKYKSNIAQPVNGTLERNKIFTVPFNLQPEEKDGFTPVTGGGGFTVQMANGQPSQKVYLGYGNLYHNPSQAGVPYEEWYVAPYQYTMNATKESSGASLTDIYYYSQTTNNFGLSVSTSNVQSNYVDWGKTIDATGESWRTLSGEEWHVLVWDRPNANKLWGYAQITGIPSTLNPNSTQTGVMFFPDDWVMPASLASTHPFKPANTTAANNSYTHEEWLLLEEAGAIFLPYTPLYGDRVSYWASGYQGNPQYSFCFHTTSLGGIHDHGTDPMFVRLVINVELVDVVPPANE